MICEACGAQNPDDSIQCEFCGNPFDIVDKLTGEYISGFSSEMIEEEQSFEE